MGNIGERIRAKRTALNMTQEELAEKLGYKSKSTINKIELGINDIVQSKVVEFAKALDTTPAYLMGWEGLEGDNFRVTKIRNSGRIPVYGRIAAGIPLEANEDIIGEIDVPAEWVDDHGALIVKGDSMYPKYQDGDIVIFKCQPDCESGTDSIVYVNGYDATLKTVYKKEDGVLLQPINPAYDPMFYGKGDETVMIAGIIVEIRRKV